MLNPPDPSLPRLPAFGGSEAKGDFPSFHAYQVARQAELTRTRIISLRATNRHLSHREIAYHTGVSVQHVTDVLGEPPAPEGMRLF